MADKPIEQVQVQVRRRPVLESSRQPAQQQSPSGLEPASADWQPPSPDELESMDERGFGLIDGAFRPRSRVVVVA
jgi:hypothetical protein